MRTLRGFYLSIAFALVGAFHAALARVSAFISTALDYLAEPFDIPRTAFSFEYGSVDGQPIDPSLLNSLRHEANVSRASAARGC